MEGQILILTTIILSIIIVVVSIMLIIRKKQKKKYTSIAEELEIEKNKITSTPVALELSKIEPLIKNDMMEDKYNRWQSKFDDIKNKRVSKIDDILLDLDLYLDKREYNNCRLQIAKAEEEIYKAREAAEHLLDEIKEVTLSEEKYRSIVTKLKGKYREANKEYQEHKSIYVDMQVAIELQLENIEKKFLDFEKVMEKNDYTEVVKIVKALDTMIDHISIVIAETPDLILMAEQLIPKRIKEVKMTSKEMIDAKYSIDYLNIDYNVEEAEKNINNILSKIKMLDLEDCMFELKTILDYMDSLFVDFEKERLSRNVYEEIENGFKIKLERINKIVDDIYGQLDDIKNMYDLGEHDVDDIHKVKRELVSINDDYKNLDNKVKQLSLPYSVLHKEIEELSNRLNKVEEDIDVSLKSLGNMQDDEERAREQLEEIEQLLQESKNIMRSYKLPIITDNYYVELKEANAAIVEVIKELEKKPIVIKTLNTRVDTARDLVLKLHNTTNEMIKTAILAEKSIVYGNRYRAYYNEIDEGITTAEGYFYKGKYKESLDQVLKSCSLIDKDIYKKIMSVYDREST